MFISKFYALLKDTCIQISTSLFGW